MNSPTPAERTIYDTLRDVMCHDDEDCADCRTDAAAIVAALVADRVAVADLARAAGLTADDLKTARPDATAPTPLGKVGRALATGMLSLIFERDARPNSPSQRTKE